MLNAQVSTGNFVFSKAIFTAGEKKTQKTEASD